MKPSRRVLVALVMCAFGLLPAQARAAAILDFGTAFAGGGGTISYGGGLGALIGQQIRIGAVTGVGTPSNNGALAVTSNTSSYGVLNFQTGAYTGFVNGAYTFAGGGYFEIIGNVLGAGVTGNSSGQSGLGNGAVLLSGTFNSARVTTDFEAGTSSFLPRGIDTKNPQLLDYFGLAGNTPFVLSGFSIGFAALPGGGAPFSTTAFSTDITNKQVPEPASLLLLGSGLTVIGSMIRRRRAEGKS